MVRVALVCIFSMLAWVLVIFLALEIVAAIDVLNSHLSSHGQDW